jgi:hypothetical protein
MANQPPAATPQPAAQPAPRPPETHARIRVKVLERREHGGKVSFLVQEEGKPRGILGFGTPPAILPEVNQEIEVYRNNNDPRSPQYRWDPPPPPPERGRGGRGHPTRGRR